MEKIGNTVTINFNYQNQNEEENYSDNFQFMPARFKGLHGFYVIEEYKDYKSLEKSRAFIFFRETNDLYTFAERLADLDFTAIENMLFYAEQWEEDENFPISSMIEIVE